MDIQSISDVPAVSADTDVVPYVHSWVSWFGIKIDTIKSPIPGILREVGWASGRHASTGDVWAGRFATVMRKQLSFLAVGSCANANWLLANTTVISKNMTDVISALQAIAYLLCRLSSEVYLQSVRRSSTNSKKRSYNHLLLLQTINCRSLQSYVTWNFLNAAWF